MPYDEELATRVRLTLAGCERTSERRRSGGIREATGVAAAKRRR
ncbi:MAG: hypothetical protein AAF682_22355 [Planctomycetota bacterium]